MFYYFLSELDEKWVTSFWKLKSVSKWGVLFCFEWVMARHGSAPPRSAVPCRAMTHLNKSLIVCSNF